MHFLYLILKMTLYTHSGDRSAMLHKDVSAVNVCGHTHQSTVWAEGLVNSHIFLGVDAAVSSQLVSL